MTAAEMHGVCHKRRVRIVYSVCISCQGAKICRIDFLKVAGRKQAHRVTDSPCVSMVVQLRPVSGWVSGQFADKPTRGQSSRGLAIARTIVKLAETFD